MWIKVDQEQEQENERNKHITLTGCLSQPSDIFAGMRCASTSTSGTSTQKTSNLNKLMKEKVLQLDFFLNHIQKLVCVMLTSSYITRNSILLSGKSINVPLTDKLDIEQCVWLTCSTLSSSALFICVIIWPEGETSY